jgi:hypothetical protein
MGCTLSTRSKVNPKTNSVHITTDLLIHDNNILNDINNEINQKINDAQKITDHIENTVKDTMNNVNSHVQQTTTIAADHTIKILEEMRQNTSQDAKLIIQAEN